MARAKIASSHLRRAHVLHYTLPVMTQQNVVRKVRRSARGPQVACASSRRNMHDFRRARRQRAVTAVRNASSLVRIVVLGGYDENPLTARPVNLIGSANSAEVRPQSPRWSPRPEQCVAACDGKKSQRCLLSLESSPGAANSFLLAAWLGGSNDTLIINPTGRGEREGEGITQP